MTQNSKIRELGSNRMRKQYYFPNINPSPISSILILNGKKCSELLQPKKLIMVL
jgi:hypothetical protein